MSARILVPVLLLALGGSCASQAKTVPTSGGGSSAKEAKEFKRQADLQQASLQLEIARLATVAGQLADEEAVQTARLEVEEAELALQRFHDFEKPTELESAQLSLDRAELSRSQNEAELQQMEEMYAAETNLDATGERTRDIVLERHRKALEFSTRQLELARARHSDQQGRVLPRKERELKQKHEKALAALRKAEEKLAQSQLERKLTLLKAKHRIAELEREGKKNGDSSGDDSK